MTRENFDSRRNLRSEMERRRESRQGIEARSLVYHYAHSRVEEYAGKLRAFDSASPRIESSRYGRLPDSYVRGSLPYLSQIFLGNTIMAVEEILISGSYSHHDFATRIKYFLSGTKFSEYVSTGDNKVIPIESNKMRAMYDAAKTDPTLTIFIESPVLMPREMYDLMRSLGLYENVKSIASANYKGNASSLIS